jgi:hypothetical protein
LKDDVHKLLWPGRLAQAGEIVYWPPAVETEVIAFCCGRHLDASVAGDAVEVVLVALIASPERSVKPEAGFDCTAGDEMVTLPGQRLSGLKMVHAALWKAYTRYIVIPMQPGFKAYLKALRALIKRVISLFCSIACKQ